jgi:hypothetical protein
MRQLADDVVGRCQRIDGGDECTGGERGEVGDHELGAVGAAERQHVALGHAVNDRAGRGLAYRLGQLPIAQHRAGGTVDKGWLGRLRGRVIKDERVQRDLGELDVVVRTLDDHASRLHGTDGGSAQETEPRTVSGYPGEVVVEPRRADYDMRGRWHALHDGGMIEQ